MAVFTTPLSTRRTEEGALDTGVSGHMLCDGKKHRKAGSWHVLGGSGDLVSRLIMGITGVTISVIGVMNLHTKSP